MKKILGAIAGVIVGYIAWMIAKYILLLSGPFVLGPMGISGPRAAANLEAVAEIVGFVVFIIVVRKIYQLVVGKKDEKKNITNANTEAK